MATTYTSITAIQDNKVSSVDWLAINNPLAFIVELTYSGDTPDYLDVLLYVDSVLKGTFKALPYSDPTATTRRFIFFADRYLKGYLDKSFDFEQTINSIVAIDLPDITFRFRPASLTTPYLDISFEAVDGFRQFNDDNGACLVDLYNNTDLLYIDSEGINYLYFKATSTATTTKLVFPDSTQINFGAVTSGNYYRLKANLNRLTPGIGVVTLQDRTLPVTIASFTIYTHKYTCGNEFLKYIDRNGQYRMLAFEGVHNRSMRSESLGNITNYVTSIVDVRGDKYSSGKMIDRQRDLKLLNFPIEYIDQVEDLIASPFVYLFIGSSFIVQDDDQDWIQVDIETSNLRYSFEGYKKFTDISLTVNLPKQYSNTVI